MEMESDTAFILGDTFVGRGVFDINFLSFPRAILIRFTSSLDESI